jgi:fructuronate reductase
MDGSEKLPVRFLPALRTERARGVLPEAAVIALGAWIQHVRRCGADVADVRAAELTELSAGALEEAVPRLLAVLDPHLAEDPDVVSAVRSAARDLPC